MLTITINGTAYEPKEREFWAADNQPCKTKYEKIRF